MAYKRKLAEKVLKKLKRKFLSENLTESTLPNKNWQQKFSKICKTFFEKRIIEIRNTIIYIVCIIFYILFVSLSYNSGYPDSNIALLKLEREVPYLHVLQLCHERSLLKSYSPLLSTFLLPKFLSEFDCKIYFTVILEWFSKERWAFVFYHCVRQKCRWMTCKMFHERYIYRRGQRLNLNFIFCWDLFFPPAFDDNLNKAAQQCAMAHKVPTLPIHNFGIIVYQMRNR